MNNSGTFQAQVTRGINDLESMRREWEELYAEASPRAYAQSYLWNFCYMTCLERQPDDVYLVAVRSGGRLRAIFPFKFCPLSFGPLKVRRWSLLMHPQTFVSEALIAPNEPVRGIIGAAIRALCSINPLGCDMVVMPRIVDGHPVARLSAVGRAHLAHFEPATSSMWFPTRQYESIIKNWSRNFKRTREQQARKLERLGAVQIRAYAGGDDSAIGFADFLGVEGSGWKGADGTRSAVNNSEEVSLFYRTIAEMLTVDPAANIFVTYLNDRPIASFFCLQLDRTRYVLKIGYDESLRTVGPGSHLLNHILKLSCEDDSIDCVNLVTGPKWAERWCPQRTIVYRIFVFPITPRGLTLRIALGLSRAYRRCRIALSRGHVQLAEE